MLANRANRAVAERHLVVLERALFLLAAILLGWYGLQQATTAFRQAALSRELESMRMPVAVPSRPMAELATGALVGRVQIPRLGVSAMVREGDDTATLRDSVGHIPLTALPGQPGNSGLAGHRDTFFRGLRNVRLGDRITVTTPREVLAYVVRRTRIVEPDDVEVLNPTPGQTLTLVTCYPFNYIGSAPKRFIVTAERIGGDGENGVHNEGTK
jgi:sortase A